ncbi:MAG: hypothetical protein AB7N24_21730 [Dehalococcoidia bacterium]
MNRSLNPGFLSRPAPWLTAAILLLVAAALSLVGARQAASAQTVSADFAPASTSSHSQSCYEWEAGKQALGGAVARCEGAGEVIYQFTPSGIPANATNIKYSALFLGHSGGGPGEIDVSITSAGGSFTIGNFLPLSTTEQWKSTISNTWGASWTPSTDVQVRMKWKSGEKIYWDGLVVTVNYTVPDHANLGITATGPTDVLQGQSIAYTLTIHNAGPDAAPDSNLNITLPSGIVALNASGCVTGGIPACDLGTINAGASKTVTVNALAALNATGSKTATFTVSTSAIDQLFLNNTAQHALTVYPKRTFNICKVWEDNNDGVTEAAKTFTFRVHHTSGRPSFDVERTISEGSSICGTVSTFDENLTIEELPTPGWANASGYPKWEYAGGPNGTGMGPMAFPKGMTGITFTNRAALDGGEDPEAAARPIHVCKVLEDNLDSVDDSASFRFELHAGGAQQPFAALDLVAVEAGGASCGDIYPADYGVSEFSDFTVEEVLTANPFWVSEAGYPAHLDGLSNAQVQAGATAHASILLDEDSTSVTFWNKYQRRHELELCKQLLDNGDGVNDSGAFQFEYHWTGNPVAFGATSITVTEGDPVPTCQTYVFELEVAPFSLPADVTVVELPQPGFTSAAGYPTWTDASQAPFALPARAVYYQDLGPWHRNITFINKATASQQSPTPTPPPATPTPSSTQPAPGSTPTPPTATPPADSTSTPSATSTPVIPAPTVETPAPEGNPGGPAESTPAEEPVPPSATPSAPDQPQPIESSSNGPVQASPTPVAPSTGTTAGVPAAGAGLSNSLGLLGLALMAAAIGVGLKRKEVRQTNQHRSTR